MATPSLTTLRAFAAAGRHESFREAARELHVTPAAISHQVRAMEEWLGLALFTREARAVRLTAVGRRLTDELSRGFAQLSEALVNARAPGADTRLRISALPLLTNAWLIPRLARFEERHPGLTVEIDTVNALADVEGGAVDVGIRNIARSPARLAQRKLIELTAVPLCSTRLASRVRRIDDLPDLPLIEHSARPGGWSRWFRQMGRPDLEPRTTLSLDSTLTAVTSAAQGRGVVLGLAPIVWDLPETLHLVAPIREPLVGAGAYTVVFRREDLTRRIVHDFVEWLISEMRADRRRLAQLHRQRLGDS